MGNSHYLPPAGLFSSSKTEALYPFNSNFAFPPLAAPDNRHSTFCLSHSDYTRYCGIGQYLSFCDCLVSLSILSSRFIPIVACVRISFLRLNPIVFIHSSVDGYLGCCCFFFFFFFLFRAKPVAYGGSQSRGQIGATAASLHHSHSHARSELYL